MKRFITALLLAAAMSGTIAAQQPAEEEIMAVEPEDEYEGMTPAEIYFHSRGLHYPLEDIYYISDYQAVNDSASKVLSLFPDDAQAAECRGLARFYLKDYPGALSDAFTAFGDDYSRLNAEKIIMAVTDYDSNLVRKGLSEKLAACPDWPESGPQASEKAEYLFLLSRACMKQGDMPAAYDYARMAHDLQPDEIGNTVHMSTILMRSGLSERAAGLLRPLVKNPEEASWSAVHNYALALRNTGHADRAVKMQKKWLELYPDDDDMRIDMAAILGAVGRYQEAIEELNLMIARRECFSTEDEELYSDEILNEALVRRGIILFNIGQPELAAIDMRKVLANSERAGRPNGFEPCCHAYLGEKAEALEVINSDYTTQYVNVASVYAVTGDYPQALRNLQLALDHYEVSPQQLAYDLNFIKLRELPQYKAMMRRFKKPSIK